MTYRDRIIEVGTPKQVFADPRHPSTQALMPVLPESIRRENWSPPGDTAGARKPVADFDVTSRGADDVLVQ